jgi:hypothetical protein
MIMSIPTHKTQSAIQRERSLAGVCPWFIAVTVPGIN